MNTNDMKRAFLQYESECASGHAVYTSWIWSKSDTTIGLCHPLLEQSVNKINRIFVQVLFKILVFRWKQNYIKKLCICFKWLCKRYFRLLVYEHKWHENGFSPVWTRMCLLTSEGDFWVWEQSEQAHNFPPTLIGTICKN